MRLIDADELIKKAYSETEGMDESCKDLGTIVEWLVDKMPTIEPEQKKGKWIIERMNTYELSYGTTAYEPVYRCSVCERLTESYLRLDEPIMPEDADFPRFCPWCGAELEVPEDV